MPSFRRRRLARGPNFRPPQRGRLAREYERDLRIHVVGPIPEVIREILIPGLEEAVPRADAAFREDQDDLRKLIDRVMQMVSPGFELIQRIARIHVLRIAVEQGADLANGFARAIDPTVKGVARRRLLEQAFDALRVDPIGREEWLADTVRDAVGENVALIRTLPQSYLGPLEDDVNAWVRQGLRHEKIAKRIEGKYVSRSIDGRAAMAGRRAKLIAVDQVGKFHAQLDERRQQHIGITHYIWRTAQDERVRGPGGKYPNAHPSHRKREGRRFEWAKAPREGHGDGHAGRPIRCRCYADPVMDEIRDFDELTTRAARISLGRRSG